MADLFDFVVAASRRSCSTAALPPCRSARSRGPCVRGSRDPCPKPIRERRDAFSAIAASPLRTGPQERVCRRHSRHARDLRRVCLAAGVGSCRGKVDERSRVASSVSRGRERVRGVLALFAVGAFVSTSRPVPLRTAPRVRGACGIRRRHVRFRRGCGFQHRRSGRGERNRARIGTGGSRLKRQPK